MFIMKVIISNKHKKDLFVALFQTLKNCSTLVNVKFQKDLLHIQGMDKSHICLFDVKIQKKWFDEYEILEDNNICIDANIFHMIISNKTEGLNIIIRTENEDNLNVDLFSVEHSKGEFNKYFKIPLADFDYEEMEVPNVDYDAEFSISSKKICDIVSQMILFGSDINVKCTEDKIDLITNGVTGEMLVNIPIEDLNEYSIVEGEVINLNYSLSYINKMCLTNKLSNEIQFFISADYPMKICYDLGEDSSMVFYIAPKMAD
jgi:proliferating cell nuclear antigen PCNA